MGIVINQVMMIFPARFHLTLENFLAAPTPRMDEVMAWVVLTGNPFNVADKITPADVRSAATPLMGSILKIFVPIVLIIFQPPTDVPRAIAVAAAILTQSGTSKSVWKPPSPRANVIIP